MTTKRDRPSERSRVSVPARSAVRLWPPPGPWEKEHENKSWPLRAFRVRCLAGCAHGTDGRCAIRVQPARVEQRRLRSSLRFVRGGRTLAAADMWEALEAYAAKPPVLPGVLDTVAVLQGSEPPCIGSLLKPGELLFDLSLGIDMGYADVIVTHSTTDLSEQLDPLVAEYESAIASSTSTTLSASSPCPRVHRVDVGAPERSIARSPRSSRSGSGGLLRAEIREPFQSPT